MQLIDLPNFGIAETQLSQKCIDLLYDDLKSQAPEGWEWDGHRIAKGTDSPQWDFNFSPETQAEFQIGVLGPMINQYVEKYGKHTLFCTSQLHGITISRCWVRCSKVHEYLSFHDHSALFSFAVWLNIPYDYKEEQTDNEAFTPYAGDFQLLYPSTTGLLLKRNYQLDRSMEGRMILFPSQINHMVYPHHTTSSATFENEYRVCVAGNIAFDSYNVIHDTAS
jgi:hypothetical protein